MNSLNTQRNISSTPGLGQSSKAAVNKHTPDNAIKLINITAARNPSDDQPNFEPVKVRTTDIDGLKKHISNDQMIDMKFSNKKDEFKNLAGNFANKTINGNAKLYLTDRFKFQNLDSSRPIHSVAHLDDSLVGQSPPSDTVEGELATLIDQKKITSEEANMLYNSLLDFDPSPDALNTDIQNEIASQRSGISIFTMSTNDSGYTTNDDDNSSVMSDLTQSTIETDENSTLSRSSSLSSASQATGRSFDEMFLNKLKMYSTTSSKNILDGVNPLSKKYNTSMMTDSARSSRINSELKKVNDSSQLKGLMMEQDIDIEFFRKDQPKETTTNAFFNTLNDKTSQKFNSLIEDQGKVGDFLKSNKKPNIRTLTKLYIAEKTMPEDKKDQFNIADQHFSGFNIDKLSEEQMIAINLGNQIMNSKK